MNKLIYKWVSRVELDKVVQLTYNQFGIKVFGLTANFDDSNHRYDIFTDEKITANRTLSVIAFTTGVVNTLRSF